MIYLKMNRYHHKNYSLCACHYDIICHQQILETALALKILQMCFINLRKLISLYQMCKLVCICTGKHSLVKVLFPQGTAKIL